MKLSFNPKNKNINFETDSEKTAQVIEKGMDLHEKDWNDKFTIKHSAKKELMELKHKESLETRKQKNEKESFINEIFNGINSNTKIKEETKIRLHEDEKNTRKENNIVSILLIIMGFIMTLLGFIFVNSENVGFLFIGITGIICLIMGFMLANKK